MRRTAALIFFTLITFSVSAQKYDSGKLRQKCLLMRRFLELNHYRPIVWDDSASSLLFDKWIEVLDEDKKYFIKADIDELNTYRYKLADELMGKNWTFFDRSITLYKKRLLLADSIETAIYNKPLDFSKSEALHLPYISYATSVEELTKRWQSAVKWQVLDNIMEDDDTTDNFTTKAPANFSKLISEAIASLKKQHEAHMESTLPPSPYFEDNLGDRYLDAICWCYDPHTNYMNLSAKKEFETEVGKFEYSVGIDLEKNDNGEWGIAKLIPGGAAWRNGDLHVGDVLLKVRSGNHPAVNLKEMTEEEVLDLLQGANDDSVAITIRSKGGTQKTVALTKEKVEDDESIVKSFELGDSAKVGYIKLPGFYSDPEDTLGLSTNGCANDVAKEIVKMKRDNIKGLIIDLRYNGGGSAWEAVQLSGIFIDIGSICSMKEKSGKVHFWKDPNRGTIYDGPLIIMVNSESASASELTSAALQDYNRALIVGSTTYGKGTAQELIPLDTTGKESAQSNTTDYVKVTDSRFYRIDGRSVQWKGVEPDISLPDLSLPEKFRERGCPSALYPDNSKPAYYDKLPDIPVAQLKKMSKARVEADSSYFNKVKAKSAIFSQEFFGVDIPLQWASFFNYTKNQEELYNEWNNENEDKPSLVKVTNNGFDAAQIALESNTSKEINNTYLSRISKDDYIRESYNIMLDWIKIKQ